MYISLCFSLSPYIYIYIYVFIYKDPAIFLLSGTNVTFGFAAAFMNGYVNAITDGIGTPDPDPNNLVSWLLRSTLINISCL